MLSSVIERLVDLGDHMNAGIGGNNDWQYRIRLMRMDLQTLLASASKPITRSGGVCGWCHEYMSQERNLFKHVQKCRANATAEERVAMRVAAVRLAQIARDLEDK